MVTCRPWCGIGVRHIQYGLMAVMNCMDYWIQSLTFSIFLYHSSSKNEARAGVLNDLRESLQPQGKVTLTDRQREWIFALSFMAYSLGRLSSALVVLRVPNKYLLVGLIIFENVAGACVVWFVQIIGLTGIVSFLAITSFCRAMHTPLMYNILAKWMPAHEYTVAWCIVAIAKETFSVFLSHFVAKMNYVESVLAFMLLSFVHLGWCATFVIFGADSPQTSFLISKQEWNYLAKTIGPRKKTHCKARVPCKSIFSCFILYMYMFLDFGKESNGTAISAAVQTIAGGQDLAGPQLICIQAALMLYSAGLLACSIYVDKVIRNQAFEAGPIRKVMSTVASCGIAITMILTAYVDRHTVKIAYLFMAQCFYIIIHFTEPCILFDLSPNYAATIYALLSFVRNLMVVGRMMLDPAVKQFDLTLKGPNVTTHIGDQSPDGLLYRYGFLMFFTNLFFIISGNIELKDFDSYDTYDWKKLSVISYP